MLHRAGCWRWWYGACEQAVTNEDDPCIGGTDLVVVARFRAAAVLRLSRSPGRRHPLRAAQPPRASPCTSRSAISQRPSRIQPNPGTIRLQWISGMARDYRRPVIIPGPWIPGARSYETR